MDIRTSSDVNNFHQECGTKTMLKIRKCCISASIKTCFTCKNVKSNWLELLFSYWNWSDFSVWFGTQRDRPTETARGPSGVKPGPDPNICWIFLLFKAETRTAASCSQSRPPVNEIWSQTGRTAAGWAEWQKVSEGDAGSFLRPDLLLFGF